MAHNFLTIFAGLLLTIPVSTQSQATGRTPSNLMSAEGTEINAALVSSLDSKTAKAGDEIVARATETIKIKGAMVPKGAKLIGHVTRVADPHGGDGKPEIGIVFDKIILKDGKEIAMHGGINALASADAGPNLPVFQTSSVEGTYGNTIEGAVSTIAYSTSKAQHAVPRTFGGLGASGQFISDSRGVFGVYGLRLGAAGSSDTDGTAIASTGSRVHVKSGTRLLVVFQVQAERGKSAAI